MLCHRRPTGFYKRTSGFDAFAQQLDAFTERSVERACVRYVHAADRSRRAFPVCGQQRLWMALSLGVALKPHVVGESAWGFPAVDEADEDGFVGVGADLEPSTLIGAYRHGLFPMPTGDGGPIAWWSPDPRGVLPLNGLVASRSLQKSCRRYRVSVDEAFDRVIDRCASIERPGGWISSAIISAYCELHRLGWAHSVETWSGDELVGGLYGVQIGGLFAGESMFHLATDASKVALVGLVEALRNCGASLLDVQWRTDHLATLGVCEIPRSDYLAALYQAIDSNCDTVKTPLFEGF